MNKLISYLLVSIFSIFLGSQIAEGFILVPYWKALNAEAFYRYYELFGPIIGSFYKTLTLIAVSIPLCLVFYSLVGKSSARKYALSSLIFAIMIIVLFYCYFKEVNAHFYSKSFDAAELKIVLCQWEKWHWVRVVCECLSLIFLIQAVKFFSK